MHSVIPACFVNQSTRRPPSTERERNIIAAIFSAILIILLIIAMVLPNWYHLKGGRCTHQVIGGEPFFYVGSSKDASPIPSSNGNITYPSLAYYGLNEEMKDCITPEIFTVQRVIIGLCFLTIFFSFCQFYFDITGVTNQSLRCTRRCGLGSIFSVLSVVVIIGLCYYASELIQQQPEMTKLYPATRIEVSFGVSYYLIAAAGVVAVLAAASNLFRCDHLSGNVDMTMLLDDHQEETFSIALPHSRTWSHIREQSACLNDLPPPPPYTP